MSSRLTLICLTITLLCCSYRAQCTLVVDYQKDLDEKPTVTNKAKILTLLTDTETGSLTALNWITLITYENCSSCLGKLRLLSKEDISQWKSVPTINASSFSYSGARMTFTFKLDGNCENYKIETITREKELDDDYYVTEKVDFAVRFTISSGKHKI